MTEPYRDPIVDGIRALLDRVVTRQNAAIDPIEAEIKMRGRRWAAAEIWRLRADLARARSRGDQ